MKSERMSILYLRKGYAWVEGETDPRLGEKRHSMAWIRQTIQGRAARACVLKARHRGICELARSMMVPGWTSRKAPTLTGPSTRLRESHRTENSHVKRTHSDLTISLRIVDPRPASSCPRVRWFCEDEEGGGARAGCKGMNKGEFTSSHLPDSCG